MRFLEKPIGEYGVDEHLDLVLRKASTPNGRFGIKIFPRYLNAVYGNFGYDFIQKCVNTHDVKIHVLKREDKLGRAISNVRARQTQQWRSYMKRKSLVRYDYSAIKAAIAEYDDIGKYWETYLHKHNMEYETYVYEDLLLDPSPWMNSLASHLDVEIPDSWKTDMKIQRDDKTKAWRARFLEDQEMAKNAGPTPANRGWFQRLADRLPN